MRTRELEQAGITRTQVVRLVSAGKLQKIGRGLYAPADYQGTEHSALVAVATIRRCGPCAFLIPRCGMVWK